MKKIFALLLAVLMVFSLAACSERSGETYGEVGTPLVDSFYENGDKTAQEIADALLSESVISFMGMTMAVEEGYLSGFGNTEIKGFDEGVMFGPMIGTIPFMGYVFDLSEGTDADEFMQTLKDNADLRWNVCTEADELVVEKNGDKVIVIMTPESFEQEEQFDENGNPLEGEVPVVGEDFEDVFAE